MGKKRLQQHIEAEENRILDMVYAECKRQGCSAKVAAHVAVNLSNDPFLMEYRNKLQQLANNGR